MPTAIPTCDWNRRMEASSRFLEIWINFTLLQHVDLNFLVEKSPAIVSCISVFYQPAKYIVSLYQSIQYIVDDRNIP